MSINTKMKELNIEVEKLENSIRSLLEDHDIKLKNFEFKLNKSIKLTTSEGLIIYDIESESIELGDLHYSINMEVAILLHNLLELFLN